MNRLNGTFGTARFNQGHEWQNDHNTILTIVINISMTCDSFTLMKIRLLINMRIKSALKTSSKILQYQLWVIKLRSSSRSFNCLQWKGEIDRRRAWICHVGGKGLGRTVFHNFSCLVAISGQCDKCFFWNWKNESWEDRHSCAV